MRKVNEATIRERRPIPTVDEVLHNLSGSVVFSKSDLRYGYHHIELEGDSRYITTFEVLHNLSGSVVFSKLNLRSQFWHQLCT